MTGTRANRSHGSLSLTLLATMFLLVVGATAAVATGEPDLARDLGGDVVTNEITTTGPTSATGSGALAVSLTPSSAGDLLEAHADHATINWSYVQTQRALQDPTSPDDWTLGIVTEQSQGERTLEAATLRITETTASSHALLVAENATIETATENPLALTPTDSTPWHVGYGTEQTVHFTAEDDGTVESLFHRHEPDTRLATWTGDLEDVDISGDLSLYVWDAKVLPDEGPSYRTGHWATNETTTTGPAPTATATHHYQFVRIQLGDATVGLDDPHTIQWQTENPQATTDGTLLLQETRAALTSSHYRWTTSNSTFEITGDLDYTLERAPRQAPDLRAAISAAEANVSLPPSEYLDTTDPTQAPGEDPAPRDDPGTQAAVSDPAPSQTETSSVESTTWAPALLTTALPLLGIGLLAGAGIWAGRTVLTNDPEDEDDTPQGRQEAPSPPDPLDPEPDPALLAAHAEQALHRGQPTQARTAAKRTLDLDPDNDDAWLVIGASHLIEGNEASVVKDLGPRFEDLEPGQEGIGYILALAHARLGHEKKARDVLEQATRSPAVEDQVELEPAFDGVWTPKGPDDEDEDVRRAYA